MWDRCKAKGRWIFAHRTKVIGACGVGAGCTENYLNSHHIAVIPEAWRGILVGVFGGIVFVVGLYNSLKDTFSSEP